MMRYYKHDCEEAQQVEICESLPFLHKGGSHCLIIVKRM